MNAIEERDRGRCAARSTARKLACYRIGCHEELDGDPIDVKPLVCEFFHAAGIDCAARGLPDLRGLGLGLVAAHLNVPDE
ncbi:MAG TPA: hypothetical protein VGL61_12735 [Kofleriaceae bacterium]